VPTTVVSILDRRRRSESADTRQCARIRVAVTDNRIKIQASEARMQTRACWCTFSGS